MEDITESRTIAPEVLIDSRVISALGVVSTADAERNNAFLALESAEERFHDSISALRLCVAMVESEQAFRKSSLEELLTETPKSIIETLKGLSDRAKWLMLARMRGQVL